MERMHVKETLVVLSLLKRAQATLLLVINLGLSDDITYDCSIKDCNVHLSIIGGKILSQTISYLYMLKFVSTQALSDS